MAVEFFATQPHFYDHLVPIVRVLQGRGIPVRCWAGTHAALQACQKHWLPYEAGGPVDGPKLGPVVTAGHVDAARYRERGAVLLDHGAGQSYCLASETRVLTGELRWIPIAELKIDTELVGFDEHRPGERGRHWRSAIVTGLQTVRKPCYRLQFSDGTKVVASEDHRWLARNRGSWTWRTTKRIQAADRYSKSSKLLKLVDVWEEDRSWGGGYLAAAFDGEGFLTQTTRREGVNRIILGFTQRDNAMLEVVKGLLDQRGFRYTQSPDRGNGVVTVNILGGCREILRFMGAVRPRRLLDGWVPLATAQMRGVAVELMEREYLGEQDVVAVETSTRTFVAEGFASHNCGLDHPSYAGGSGRDTVRLFLAPREEVAERDRARYPKAKVVVVGSPRVQDLQRIRAEAQEAHRIRAEVRSSSPSPTAGPDPPQSGPAVAFSSHWDTDLGVPEMRPALPYYEQVLDKSWAMHAHPRARRLLRGWSGATIREFEHVIAWADVYVTDNSSTLYEAAACAIPTVALNAPWYRRDVSHGLRFWDLIPGDQCNEPKDLNDRIWWALHDGADLKAQRAWVINQVYDQVGDPAGRAADAIMEVYG